MIMHADVRSLLILLVTLVTGGWKQSEVIDVYTTQVSTFGVYAQGLNAAFSGRTDKGVFALPMTLVYTPRGR